MMTFANSTSTFATEVFEAEVILSPPAPSVVGVGTPVLATVDFGHSFFSIERICFIFHFQDDLLDPGDLLSFTGPFGLNGAGFENITPNPQDSRTICFTASLHPETISLFLDGQQDFGIQMEAGSVIIGALTIQITGQDKINVSVDIKPGSDPNCFNSDGHGAIPVAILSTADFDATEVDPLTVMLDSQEVRVVGKGNAQYHIEDANGDGLNDLVVHIEDIDGAYDVGDTIATLVGNLFDGTPIEGTDTICIVP